MQRESGGVVGPDQLLEDLDHTIGDATDRAHGHGAESLDRVPHAQVERGDLAEDLVGSDLAGDVGQGAAVGLDPGDRERVARDPDDRAVEVSSAWTRRSAWTLVVICGRIGASWSSVPTAGVLVDTCVRGATRLGCSRPALA